MSTRCNDECSSCNSNETYRQTMTNLSIELFCNSCFHREPFIDASEMDVSPLSRRVDALEHDEARRNAMIRKWFTH